MAAFGGGVADTMWMKSRSCATAGDAVGELAVLEGLVARFESSVEPYVQLLVARAYYNIGGLLDQAGRRDGALRAWDEAVERSVTARLPGAELLAIDAVFNKANCLMRLGRLDDATATCDVLLERYGEDDPSRTPITIGLAMGMRLHCLMAAGRGGEALLAADQLLVRYGGSTEPELRSEISRALLAKTWVELQLDRRVAAIAASNELLAEFENATDPARVALVGDALRRAGTTLVGYETFGAFRFWSNRRNKDCHDHGLRILGLLRTRLASSDDPELRKLAVLVMIDTGEALARLGRVGQAAAVFDDVFDSGEPALAALKEAEGFAEEWTRPRERLALIFAGEVAVLEELGHRGEADAKLSELIAEFQDDRSPMIRLIVSRALRELDTSSGCT
jgi:tetratricopeptide (TPR) repeat protein